jgi:acyl-CoA thioester hydrolase
VSTQFSVRVTVRSYEIDSNGHVNHAVYHQYGEYARTEHMRMAGFTPAAALERGMGMVLLESRIRFLRELVLGDEVEITSDVEFGTGKAFHIEHRMRRGDGEPVAEISCVLGLLDTTARRLLPEPARRLRELAGPSGLLG